MGMDSGWTTFGRVLLPSWASIKQKQEEGSSLDGGAMLSNSTNDTSFDVTDEKSNAFDVAIGSLDDNNSTSIGSELGGDINETRVEDLADGPDSMDSGNLTSPIEVAPRSLDKPSRIPRVISTVVKYIQGRGRRVAKSAAIADEFQVVSEDTDEVVISEHREDSKPILSSFESSDIDKTTLSKKMKWARRRTRLHVLFNALRSAAFLFVLTLLAGNILNQVVDLDDEGSFEVHYGKALSSKAPKSLPKSSPLEQDSPKKSPSPSSKKKLEPQATNVHTQPHNTYAVRGSQPLRLVASAVKRNGPAIVRVETETDLDSKIAIDEEADDKGSRGDVFDGIPDVPSVPSQIDQVDFGQGSGIIIDSKGYCRVLTNAHVVEGADRIRIHLPDGRQFTAELAGSDPIVDVALLKIVPDPDGDSELPVASIGNSDSLECGQFVVAVGTPGGLDNSCTLGIVSGLKRSPKMVGIPDKLGALDYVQTDAAINQGNSGGALIDVESGNVIAINCCIRANMEGTSFAIPINKALSIVDDLSEGRLVEHGYIGVHLMTMNPSLARFHNRLSTGKRRIPERSGVMVETIFKSSPAKDAGLKRYDYIESIDGQRVRSADDAHLLIDRAKPGKAIIIKIFRGQQEMDLKCSPKDLSKHLENLRKTKKAKGSS